MTEDKFQFPIVLNSALELRLVEKPGLNDSVCDVTTGMDLLNSFTLKTDH